MIASARKDENRAANAKPGPSPTSLLRKVDHFSEYPSTIAKATTYLSYSPNGRRNFTRVFRTAQIRLRQRASVPAVVEHFQRPLPVLGKTLLHERKGEHIVLGHHLSSIKQVKTITTSPIPAPYICQSKKHSKLTRISSFGSPARCANPNPCPSTNSLKHSCAATRT